MQSIVNLDAVFVILNRVQAKRRVENMSEKILIIDDEQDIADLLEVYLKRSKESIPICSLKHMYLGFALYLR